MIPVFRVEEFSEIPSTSDSLRERAILGEAEGLVLRADIQTAGRGRRGRNWVSPKGNLYASVLLRPPVTPRQAATLGLVASLCLASVFTHLTSRTVNVKWPNDVLIDGAKVSGLLLDSAMAAEGTVDWLVLGLGVNVVSHPAELPYAATHLIATDEAPISPRDLLNLVLADFGPAYAAWRERGFEPFRNAWLARAIGRDRPISARLERETVEGRFADLDADGVLILETADGGRRRIAAGDIVLA